MVNCDLTIISKNEYHCVLRSTIILYTINISFSNPTCIIANLSFCGKNQVYALPAHDSTHSIIDQC